MHSLIAWFVRNPVAANLLMLAIIFGGLYAVFKKIPLETFPAFERSTINVAGFYPGATPSEVEQGVILKMEDAISDLPGIDRIFSDANEGSALLRVEVREGYDTTKVLNDIKSRIDGIGNFPEGVERTLVEQQVRLRNVITVVIGMKGDNERQLRKTAESIRDELRNLAGITQLALGGIRAWEISITIPKAVLEQYGLTLSGVATRIKNSSRDIPAGTIKTLSGDIRVRSLGQAYTKADFANISILSRTDGTRIRLGEIATIIDGFNDDPLYSRFDGMAAAFINIYRVGDQNAIKLATTVKNYIKERNHSLPKGVKLSYWRDQSKVVEARLNTLLKSALQGILLVFILLTLFLRPALAWWVGLGIPISFLGALLVMPYIGVTLNIVSMFAFIIVLGIVVDDAIVTGENVYTHLQQHNDPVKAAIEGTQEMAIPVTFGVLTTVAAFMPLLLLDGQRAPIFAQIPMIVIPVLLFSLIESKMILPAHLQHVKKRDPNKAGLFTRIQQGISQGLERYVDKIHRPILEFSLNWRYATVAVFIVVLAITLAMVMSGRYKYVFFPRIASEYVSATLLMPEGTAVETTSRHIMRMTRAAEKLQQIHKEPNGESIIQHILVTIGSGGSRRPKDSTRGKSHKASVSFEVMPPEIRKNTITTRQLVAEWRRLIGTIPGVQELSFRAEMGRGGDPINIQLTGYDFEELNEVGEKIKIRLGEFDNLFDIKNSFEVGKTEVQLRLKPEAEQLGINMVTLGQQVRNAISGAEAQRIQRNQSEVKVMVQYPKEERYSLSDLQNLKIKTPKGVDIPLLDVADLVIGKGMAKISRVDRKRIINITSDLDKKKADASAITETMNEWIRELLKAYPAINFDPEGEQLEQKKFGQSLMSGFIIALIMIYVLLAIPLQSYFQPIMVMIVIPFSLTGAILGHVIMGINLSISSMMGMLALMGVVVNDSLVLVDYTNKRIKAGMPLIEAIRFAGGARFRPILLTSVTTFAGLTPLIFDKSTQAQFLIPMAVSLGFGILFATLLTLFLIPSFYLILEDIKRIFAYLWNAFLIAFGRRDYPE